MQTAIVCFNKEMDLRLKKMLHKEINHCSIAFEHKPDEITHITWTGKAFSVIAGAITRDDFIKSAVGGGAKIIEYPIREDWTPCIGPFTCVSLVKRAIGLGPFTAHLLTPYQLYRYLRR